MPVKAVPVEAAEEAGEPPKPPPEEPVAAETKKEEVSEKPAPQGQKSCKGQGKAAYCKGCQESRREGPGGLRQGRREGEEGAREGRHEGSCQVPCMPPHCIAALFALYAQVLTGGPGQEAENPDSRREVRDERSRAGGGGASRSDSRSETRCACPEKSRQVHARRL